MHIWGALHTRKFCGVIRGSAILREMAYWQRQMKKGMSLQMNKSLQDEQTAPVTEDLSAAIEASASAAGKKNINTL